MTVSASVNELINKLPKERRQKITERRKQLRAEYQTIQDIRKALSYTQEQLAKALEIKQSNVSQLEKRTDLLISTLRSYIEAMGGELHLVAEFPDRPPVFVDGLIGDDDSGESAATQADAEHDRSTGKLADA